MKKIFVVLLILSAIIFVFASSLTNSETENIKENVNGFLDAVEEEANKPTK